MTRWSYRVAAVAAGLAFAAPAFPCHDSVATTQEQPQKKQTVASNAPTKAPAKAKAAKSGT